MIKDLVEKQNRFFRKKITLSTDFRKAQLKKLDAAIERYDDKISKALNKDLGKSRAESYMCEVGLTRSEISYQIKHMNAFARIRRVRTPVTQFFARSFIRPCPYGNVLVMSPWNYPFLLSLEPLVDALAAGNTVILKPSAYSPATSRVLKEMLSEIYPQEYVTVVEGGREENADLLAQKFDYIFFTGSKSVGRLVMKSASEYLTPITLELGGKSPCIIDESANLKVAARRIVWGKYLNCGQTCVAPDYIMVHENVHDKFIEYFKKEIKIQFGTDALNDPHYGKIVNEKHFDRVKGLIDASADKVVCGGNSDRMTLKIEPTLMTGITREDAVMGEEIFGPVMPVLTWSSKQKMMDEINDCDRPLALYVFTRSREFADDVMSTIRFGGGCINDCISHLATPYMGFGGVGESGMGSYHGKQGFDTFSHFKSVMDKKTFFDMPVRYRPYTKAKMKLLGRLLK